MDKTLPDGYMQDAHGRLVPKDLVKEVDLLRDTLVMEIVSRANTVSKQLSEFKSKAMEDIQAFTELSVEKYGVKYGGRKGNLSLMSFDGEYRVVVAISDSLVFYERFAGRKISYRQNASEIGPRYKAELRVLINDA